MKDINKTNSNSNNSDILVKMSDKFVTYMVRHGFRLISCSGKKNYTVAQQIDFSQNKKDFGNVRIGLYNQQHGDYTFYRWLSCPAVKFLNMEFTADNGQERVYKNTAESLRDKFVAQYKMKIAQ